MSERVEQRLFELLGKPDESPYGNPIPGLEELGGKVAPVFAAGLVTLVEAMSTYSPEQSVTIHRLSERIQVEPELLTQLDEGGLRPGASISLAQVGEYISVRVPGIDGALELPPEVAAHVFVAMN